ncbi:DUF5677 domain-containing protein [uncultured Serinicoccus sp.]|uniref:DUF5677 domain-containing protein n=1 Tax=uncultured Serinicoccus sp. TaxID=735514 RepID=UPI0026301BE5|nr:DUF5677 domain-containing protein [uncultured Serinicoccus sp.]
MKLPRPTEPTGPLQGHVRRGRTYSTPLAASGILQIGNWIRDDLPDLLWPALFLAEKGSSRVAVQFVRFQKDVLDDLRDLIERDAQLTDCLDGSLTGLDRLVEREPSAQDVVVQRADEHGLRTHTVARALGVYPQRPAKWLFDNTHGRPTSDDAALLATAVREAITDGHREAIVKCLRFWAAIQGGTLSADRGFIELLRNYPVDEATRSLADTNIRAAWGARRAADSIAHPEYAQPRADWARAFWQVNSLFTQCVRARELRGATGRVRGGPEGDPSACDPPSRSTGKPGTRDAGDTSPLDLADVMEPEQDRDWTDDQPETIGLQPGDFRQRAMDLFTSYVEAIETGAQRIYDPDAQEVHTGIVSRAAREVITGLGTPDLWCTEHGSHIGRTLVESRIVLAWMSTQDEEIYRKYKAYGAGKAKLNSLIAREIPPEWLLNGASDAIDEMSRLSHNDDLLDYVSVDLGSTFSGKTLRTMADEAGLLDLYRHAFQLQSGFTHSEWWAVEMECMERCRNVLHRGHLIPSLDLAYGGVVTVGRAWVIALHGLIRASLEILDTDEEVVREAFAWLLPSHTTPDPPPDMSTSVGDQR